MTDIEDQEIDLAQAVGANAPTSVQQIILYIPDVDCDGKKIKKHQAWVKRGAKLLAEMGGGYTISPAVEGGWLSPIGRLIIDRPTIIYSYLLSDFSTHLPALRKFLHDLGRETRQGEVAFALDGVFYRITQFDRRSHGE